MLRPLLNLARTTIHQPAHHIGWQAAPGVAVLCRRSLAAATTGIRSPEAKAAKLEVRPERQKDAPTQVSVRSGHERSEIACHLAPVELNFIVLNRGQCWPRPSHFFATHAIRPPLVCSMFLATNRSVEGWASRSSGPVGRSRLSGAPLKTRTLLSAAARL